MKMDPLSKKNEVNSYLIQLQELECKRIGYELHEGLAQKLYSVYTGLQIIEQKVQEQLVKTFTKEMILTMERSIHDTRRLSVELYPLTLSTLGLLPAMKSYASLYTSTFGILVEFESTGDGRELGEVINLAIFRVYQEALTNVAKYADTDQVVTSFTWSGRSVTISIKDEGKGFDVQDVLLEDRGPGILAMMERMRLSGGECRVVSKKGMGTEVIMEVPIPL
jgi:signal transduction histidine kinase